MGMYTEIFVAARIPNESKAVPVLQHMLGQRDRPEELPAHPLFNTSRWDFMLQCTSYYFVPRTVRLLEWDEIGQYWCLLAYSSFKNYDNEAELFFDWLSGVVEEDDEMLGYTRYEEDLYPKVYFRTKEKSV